MKTKKTMVCLVLLVVFITCFICAGCRSAKMQADINEAPTDHLLIPEEKSKEPNNTANNDDSVDYKGGYELDTETIYSTILVDHEYKYCKFMDKTTGRLVEFYAGPTEMLMIDKMNDVSSYYTETFEDINQMYTSPLVKLYSEFKDLDFELVDGISDDYDVFEAVQVVEVKRSEHVKYNLYTVKMHWIDNQDYEFKYYDYADDSILITAEAPNEINPMITADTPWIVDMDELCVYNSETEERVELELVNIQVGEGITPNQNTTITETKENKIRLYVNRDTEERAKLHYPNDDNDTMINILHDIEIIKPELNDSMVKMDATQAQNTLTLIYMLETLI